MSTLAKFNLVFAAGLYFASSAAASTVEYTFSANVSFEIRGNQLATVDQQFFLPLAHISGSFEYDNSAAPIPAENGTTYESVFNLSASIEGNSFSDPGGGTLVINDGVESCRIDPKASVSRGC